MKQYTNYHHIMKNDDLIDDLEKQRPNGCICNTREWGGEIPPVCPSFHPMSDEEPDICKSCEHEEGCHP